MDDTVKVVCPSCGMRMWLTKTDKGMPVYICTNPAHYKAIRID